MSTSGQQSAAESRQLFFGQLPVFDPNPALWVRIQTLERRQQRRRRRLRFGILGGAGALALALIALALPGGSWRSGAADELAARQATSRQLQERLVSRSSGQGDFSAGSALRVIDAELQEAYDRNAADDELKALWALRNEILRALVADGRSIQSVTRI